jgi:hypothetical protein
MFRTVKSLSRGDCDESSLGGTSARICGVKPAAENRFYKSPPKNIFEKSRARRQEIAGWFSETPAESASLD